MAAQGSQQPGQPAPASPLGDQASPFQVGLRLGKYKIGSTPADVQAQVITVHTQYVETAILLLRIDDIVSGSKKRDGGDGPQQQMPE